MNLHWIDWTVVIAVASFFVFMAWFTRRYTRSVADFMAANRCAGRYVLAVAYGISSLGAITVVAEFQKYYKAGFTAVWWQFIQFAVMIMIAVTGWVAYRYRETRVFTLAQFFEMRYSKNFRKFAGLLAFGAGLINFGIFPAVGGKFFIYFCGLPQSVAFLGMEVSMFAILMFVLLAVSLFFTLAGGQIAVIVTDFLQGLFCNVVFIVIIVVIFAKFDWTTMVEGLNMAAADQSRFNPFKTSGIGDFNMWFFLIIAFNMFYTHLAWQGQQGYFCSAKSPHEQKMALVLANWRFVALTLLLLLLALSSFVILNHPKFSGIATQVNDTLSTIENQQVREQVRIPLALVNTLPIGIVGAFCAVMLAAFISTHDTYLHTWGSIFIQDVVLPFRKTPLNNKQHMLVLRCAVIGVAVFVFIWSLLFRQTQDILMYFQITGAIFTGGVGAAIIGGLYWKKGTTAGAWSAMITGGVLATSGVILKQIHDRHPFSNDVLKSIASNTGAVLAFWASIIAIIVYIVVSLLTTKEDFNLDKILHRGKYAIEGDHVRNTKPVTGLKALVGGPEYSLRDKIISISVLIWGGFWFAFFLAGSAYHKLVKPIPDQTWIDFWHFYVYLSFIVGIIVTIWFAIGGLQNLGDMFRTLGSANRDFSDDGTVTAGSNDHPITEPTQEA